MTINDPLQRLHSPPVAMCPRTIHLLSYYWRKLLSENSASSEMSHVSAHSVEIVKKTLDERHPDIVAIELDLGRFNTLKKDVKEPTETLDRWF